MLRSACRSASSLSVVCMPLSGEVVYSGTLVGKLIFVKRLLLLVNTKNIDI